MSRSLRLQYPGGWYHVMNRGLAKQVIFHNDKHYQAFLDLLVEIHHRYKTEIHAYCLMPNHYHLCIHTPLGNLSGAMRHLNGLYTQRYNKLLKRDGPLFRGRYKSIVVDADNYLLALSRYIHLNPVMAKLTHRAEAYPWSSYSAYLEKTKEPCWLTTKNTLDHFGNNDCRKKYKLFVEEGIDKELNDYFKKEKRIPILGGEIFVKTMKENHLRERHKIREIPGHQQIEKRPSIGKIRHAILSYYQLDSSALDGRTRGDASMPKMAFIYLARNHGQNDLQCIADNLGKIGPTAVSRSCRAFEKKLFKEAELQEDIKRLTALIYA